MRARSRRIVLILIILAAIPGAGLLYLWRERGRDAEARSARQDGLSAFASGEYARAVQKLGQFIKRLDPDALALLRYAQAIRVLPGADAHHLESAIVALRRCVAKDSDNAEARRDLLELYRQVGMRTETVEQADWFLDRDPSDERALIAKATAFAGMNKFADALAVLKDRVGPDSPRLELQLIYIGLMARLKQSPAEVLLRAEAVEAANATDRRFGLVGAQARILIDDTPGAAVVLRNLVALAGTDVGFAKLLVPYLDVVGLTSESLKILLAFSVKDLGPEMKGDLVKRLWEVDDALAIERNVSSWNSERSLMPTRVLAYEILALCHLRRPDEAGSLLEILRGRQDDVVAVGWVRLLEGVTLANAPTVSSRIAACLRAIESDPDNPQCQFELGLACRDAGEVELAVRALQRAGALAGSWPKPAAVGARILAESGQLPAAVLAATAADRRGSKDPSVGLLMMLARSAGGTGGGGTLAERLLHGMERAGRAARETLPIRLALAASKGATAEVKGLIEEVLASPEKPDGEILLACLLLSQKEGLGLESRFAERYEELYGNTPALALTLARQAAGVHGVAAGRALLQSRRAAAKESGSSAWSGAEAAFLEAFATPEEALDAWRYTAKRAKEEPKRLRAVLDASSPWTDRGFVRETILDLEAATGKSCLWWQYYDARWKLGAQSVDESVSDAAMAQLRGVLEVAAEHAPARLLLAGAYDARGQWQKALDQLIILKGSGRPSPGLDLSIVRSHLRLGNWTAARDLLEELQRDDSSAARALSDQQRLAMVSMFAILGDPKSMRDQLGKLDVEPVGAEEIQRRAELYAAAGELDLAHRIIGPAAVASSSPQALLLAAALADIQGRPAEAQGMLARLDVLVADPLRRQRLLADHFLRVQRPERAEEALRAAVSLNGSAGADWSRLLEFQVLQGEVDDAITTLGLGRSRGWFSMKDSNEDLSADIIRLVGANAPLRALGLVYVRDAARRSVAEQAIRLLVAADTSEPTPADRTQLRSLAAGNAKFLELQLAMAEFLRRRGEFGDAVVVCRTATVNFPAAPEPHRAMAYCYRSMGLTELAAAAGREWRSRSPGATLAADVFLAQQATPAEAAALLAPYLDRAMERGMHDVLVLYGAARIMQGEAEQLGALLGPRLATSRTVVLSWIELAGLLARRDDAMRASHWLKRDELSGIAAKDAEVRVELATAWHVLAEKTGRQEDREKTRQLLAPAAGDEPVSAKAWARIGQLYEASSEVQRAEDAYRAALRIDEDSLVAANNLAMILARSGRAVSAQPLADRLVLRRPDLAEYGDTRAFVYSQLGRLDVALSQYEKCRWLEPQNVDWALKILDVMLSQRDISGAADRLRSMSSAYREERMSPVQRKRWAELARTLGVPLGK